MNKTQFGITKDYDDALKQQILSAFHNDYMEGLANENVGFAQTTTFKILNHMYNSYGKITPRQMDYSTHTMVTP